MALPWLTNKFLIKYHNFFANEFFANGIFKIMLPPPDIFEIKYGIKSFGGQFCVKKAFNGTYATWIRICPFSDNTSMDEVISILVHEMIHYYIYKAKIHDTSSHGIYFKNIMNQINSLFYKNNCYNLGKIYVNIHCTRRGIESEGFKKYKLIIYRINSIYYCARINDSKYIYFTNFLKELLSEGRINTFGWFTSKNHIFDAYRECNKNISSRKIGSTQELKQFTQNYGITKYVEEIEEF